MEKDEKKETVTEIKIGGKPKKLVISAGARAKLSGDDIYLGLQLHSMGDWGEDYEHNCAYYDGLMGVEVQFLSVFRGKDDLEYWVITKIDASISILLPEEYKRAPAVGGSKKEAVTQHGN